LVLTVLSFVFDLRPLILSFLSRDPLTPSATSSSGVKYEMYKKRKKTRALYRMRRYFSGCSRSILVCVVARNTRCVSCTAQKEENLIVIIDYQRRVNVVFCCDLQLIAPTNYIYSRQCVLDTGVCIGRYYTCLLYRSGCREICETRPAITARHLL